MKSMQRTVLSAAILAAGTMLAAPAFALCDNCGTVTNVKTVKKEGEASGGGAVIGGVLGGVLGHQVGSGNGRTAATALGVVGGALLGNSIEAQNNGPRVYESYRVSIQTDNGSFRAYDVPSPGDLRIGDRVRIDNGQISRF